MRSPYPPPTLRACLLLVGLVCALSAAGQRPILRTLALPYSLREIPITAMAQDGAGQLWLSGNGVLVRYDGLELDRIADAENLSNAPITSLYGDTDGSIWIGHRSGEITHYKNGQFTPYEPAEGHPSQPISVMLRGTEGYLWYGTNGEGLYYDTGERVYLLDDGTTDFPDNTVHTLLSDTSGTLWAGTDAGFCSLTPTDGVYKIQGYSQTNGLPDNLVKGLAWAGGGKLWVAMQDSGVVRFDPATGTFERPFAWRFGSLENMAAAPTGELWLATTSGLVQYEPRTGATTLYTQKQGLPATEVRHVFNDRENTVWAATKRGIGHLLGDRFRFFGQNDGLASENVSCVFSDRNGDYWIGTDEGITRYTTGADGTLTVKYYLNNPNLPKEAKVVLAIDQDSNGHIWAGTYGGGAFRIDPKTDRLERFTSSDGLGNDNIFAIATGTNTVWFGTLGGGITKATINGTTPQFKVYSYRDGLAGDYVYSVTVGIDEKVYIGTDATGFSVFDGTKFTNYSEEQGLPAETVYRIVQDSSGTVFLLTPTKGVIKFDGTKFYPWNTLDLSDGQEANLMVLDRDGHLIVASEGNLGRFDRTDSTASLYNEADGLRNFEPNLNAGYCDATGIVWIGTSTGIVRYNPVTESPAENPPQVAITRFRVEFQDQPMTAGLALQPQDNNITFDYLGVNLASPGRVRYQYKLEGQDKDWSLETQSRFVTYPNLPPGEYTFKVRASINPGQWTAEPASYTFEVLPPLWMRWYFITGVVLVLAGSTYQYFRWRIARVKRENLILEQRVDERTREVVAQKEIIEAKNNELEQANEEIEAKNQDITESIVYASRIQEAILPEAERVNSHLKDLMVYYKAKDIVSGDFYWFEQQQHHSYLAAVDCTGHGVPGALLSVMGYNLLNQIAYQSPGCTPDQMLHQLDKGIYDALRRKMDPEQAPNDGMDVALCAVDHANQEVLFAGAYRPLYYFQSGEFHELKGSRYPIGGGYEGKEFELHRVPFSPGDRFFIFSDGLVDQFGGPNGRKFTPGRLKRFLEEHKDKPLEAQQALLQQAFEDWQGDQEQLDDVMLIGFQPA